MLIPPLASAVARRKGSNHAVKQARLQGVKVARKNESMNKKTRFVILSVERGEPRGYFVAIHGLSPMFGELPKARRFDTEASAKNYADAELFSTPNASLIQAAL